MFLFFVEGSVVCVYVVCCVRVLVLLTLQTALVLLNPNVKKHLLYWISVVVIIVTIITVIIEIIIVIIITIIIRNGVCDEHLFRTNRYRLTVRQI